MSVMRAAGGMGSFYGSQGLKAPTFLLHERGTEGPLFHSKSRVGSRLDQLEGPFFHIRLALEHQDHSSRSRALFHVNAPAQIKRA
jgi:hypothetical protein